MNIPEAITLLRKVRAYRPAMQIDEYSADAWAEALHDVRLVDATEAVAAIGRRCSDWMDPSMIRVEVKRLRNKRCNDNGFDRLEPPAFTTVVEYKAWLQEARTRLADGETAEQINAAADRGELKPRTIRALGHRLEETA